MKLTGWFSMGEEYSFFPKDKLLAWNIRMDFFLVLSQSLLLVLLYKYIPPQIPLFFSQPWGDDQLVDKIYICLIPATLLLVFIVNIFLSSLFFQKEKLLSRIIIFTTTLIFVLLTVTFIKILTLTTI